jgi:hypothetical protein
VACCGRIFAAPLTGVRPAQTRRWLEAGVCAALVADLRRLLRVAAGRAGQPSAAILDSRTLQSTPQNGARAGYDRHQRRKGSKLHAAVDTLGHLLAQVATLVQAVQEVTGASVELAYVDALATLAIHRLPLTQLRMASAWRSSSSPKSNAASGWCHVAGSSSVISPGRRAFAVSLATMHACQPDQPGVG